MSKVILEARDLSLHFPYGRQFLNSHKQKVHAVDGVSFQLKEGETLGLVGESGCGKSSLGKALLNLHKPTAGQVIYRDQNIAGLRDKDMRHYRKELQMIFQDPFESLNSRHTVQTILEEPLIIHRQGDRRSRAKTVAGLLDRVGLPASAAAKYPHEFSGGQRQRIGIARAIALKPKVLICDEAVSALDVSVQAQILNLLVDIQAEMKLSMLFISHDLAVVKHMSDRIAVMYLGEIIECDDTNALYNNARHPYTQALLAAIPKIFSDPGATPGLSGDIPSAIQPPTGCRFHTRCPHQQPICRSTAPPLSTSGTQHKQIACHFWQEIAERQ